MELLLVLPSHFVPTGQSAALVSQGIEADKHIFDVPFEHCIYMSGIQLGSM